MNRKKIASALALILVLNTGTLVKADIQNDINQKQQQLNDYGSQINGLKSQQNNIDNNSSQINTDIQNALNDINTKNTDLQNLQLNIQDLENKINLKQQDINNTKASISGLEKIISVNEEKLNLKEMERQIKEKQLNEKIKYAYMQNLNNELSKILLSSENFPDLLTRLKFIEMITNGNKKQVQEIVDFKNDLKKQQDDLNKQRNDLLTKNDTLTKDQVSLSQSKDDLVNKKNMRQSEIDNLKSAESQKEDMLKNLASQKQNIQQQIDDLTEYSNKTQQDMTNLYNVLSSKKYDQNTQNYLNGISINFMTPTKGYVSCVYGPRINPVTKQKGFHTGVDIANSSGTPIYAAQNGVISFASYFGAYGNAVIINHGNGYTTMYGHTSKIIVSEGQRVVKGQLIAYMGSTGWSTGPHLHFEIRKDNVSQNPLNYINVK